MKKTALRFTRSMILSAIVVWVSPLQAQDYETVRATAAMAREAAKAGEWEAAEQRLITARTGCPEGAAGQPCRLLLNFNLGYLLERRSHAEPRRRTELLKKSAAAYERVLAEAPGHASTTNNLALVLSSLGSVADLQRLFETLQQTAPEQAAAIAILSGDLLQTKTRWQAAFDAYARAAQLAPYDDTPRRKMVEIYHQLPFDHDGTFLRLLHTWEPRFAAVAEEGYRTVVRRRAGDAQAQAEQALLRWVLLAAKQRTISADIVSQGFAGSDYMPVQELRDFLKFIEQEEAELFPDRDHVSNFLGKSWSGNRYRWWTARLERRHALGLVALAVGHAAVVQRHPGQAEKRWIFGLRYAPRMEDYVLGRLREHTFIPLELITELAWLQFRYPHLDRREEKFKFFIGLLFKGKATAYEARDLRAIQRHHTVLGEIFAAKGVWKSSWADNAIFQLSHAIRTATRREKQEGLYQPLPGLKARLAEGYNRIGKSKEAIITTIDAVQAYLDTDDLGRAKELLDPVRTSAVPREARDRTAALKEILASRQAIHVRLQAVAPSPPFRPVMALPDWLAAEHLPGLPDDGLRRQQFKANAELAELASRENRMTDAKDRARAALVAAEQLSTLVGPADTLRLERAAALAITSERTSWQTPAVKVVYEQKRPVDMTGTWTLSLFSTEEPLYATLPKSIGMQAPVPAD